MKIQDDFFDASYRAVVLSPTVLNVRSWVYDREKNGNQNYSCQYCYDFKARIVTVFSDGNVLVAAIPFSQLEIEDIQRYWQKLKDLGGDPPALFFILDKSPPKPCSGVSTPHGGVG